MSDPQIIIDKLFEKLDNARSSGEVQQTTHALRIQITNKKKAGLALSAREKAMVASMGEITKPAKTGFGPGLIVVIVVVGAVIYAVYAYLPWQQWMH